MHASPPRPPVPRRPALLNELGQRQTPPCGPETFQILGSGPRVIVLGLGPEPDVAAAIVRDLEKSRGKIPEIIYADCPEFTAQMAENPLHALVCPPAHWRKMTGGEVERLLKDLPGAKAATFVLYLPGLRLFPSFFGPLFGAVWAYLDPPGRGSAAAPRSGRDIRSVTLVGSEQGLLHRELCLAFAAQGIEVKLWVPEAGRDTPGAARLDAVGPGPAAPPEDSLGDLFLSVNFKGLDPFGAVYHYLRARDAAVAVWCVDNPWHLISGLRSPYWRDLPLFVTDHSFLSGLKAHGAKRARHLPLAACPELFAPAPPDAAPSGLEPEYLKNLAPLVFVGRTAFPGRDKFFAAQRLPETLLAEALRSLDAGGGPDFLYWAEALGLAKLWPGQEARRAGLAAEECSRRRRTLCVSTAARRMQNSGAPGLTLFGDAAWREELADLPEDRLDLRGTLDYYNELPGLYRASELVLNVTSLLLPAGLNQRHFDVWTAGAAQICDPSPGLDIFPQELVQPLLFRTPADIPARAEALLSDPARLRGLTRDWRALLLAEHTYVHRIQAMLNALESIR